MNLNDPELEQRVELLEELLQEVVNAVENVLEVDARLDRVSDFVKTMEELYPRIKEALDPE